MNHNIHKLTVQHKEVNELSKTEYDEFVKKGIPDLVVLLYEVLFTVEHCFIIVSYVQLAYCYIALC